MSSVQQQESEMPSESQRSVTDYFSKASANPHTPPTPPVENAKRVRFDNTTSVPDADAVATGSLLAPSIPPEIAAMSQDDKLNRILEKVLSSDAKLSVIAGRVSTLEQSQQFMNSEVEAQKAEIVALKSEKTALQGQLSAMEARVRNLEVGLSIESKKRDDNENISRKQCLEFSGIPKLPNETRDDPKKLVAKVMSLIGSTNTISAIDDAHRKMGGGLIARFKSREERNEVYNLRFNLTGRTCDELEGFEHLAEQGSELYINESLTMDRSRLLKLIREKLKVLNRGVVKEAKIKVKTEGGIIKCQNIGGLYIKMSSMADFDRLHPNQIECHTFNN